jgi:hypothetical protein
MFQEEVRVRFFEQLKAKLEHTPSRNFDQRMNALMDLEMGKIHARSRGLLFRLKILMPATALSVLIALYFYSNSMQSGLTMEPFHENIEFLQNYETLGSVEEEELINASDEEWAEALAGVES